MKASEERKRGIGKVSSLEERGSGLLGANDGRGACSVRTDRFPLVRIGEGEILAVGRDFSVIFLPPRSAGVKHGRCSRCCSLASVERALKPISAVAEG